MEAGPFAMPGVWRGSVGVIGQNVLVLSYNPSVVPRSGMFPSLADR